MIKSYLFSSVPDYSYTRYYIFNTEDDINFHSYLYGYENFSLEHLRIKKLEKQIRVFPPDDMDLFKEYTSAMYHQTVYSWVWLYNSKENNYIIEYIEQDDLGIYFINMKNEKIYLNRSKDCIKIKSYEFNSRVINCIND